MDLELQWHGPYSVVEGTSVPCLFTSEDIAVRQPGVYLWTVPQANEVLIYYVGKTDECFTTRLWTEFRAVRKKAWDWIIDPDDKKKRTNRPDCWDWIPDPDRLQQGVKAWVYEPRGVRKPDVEKWISDEVRCIDHWKRFVQILRIFVAPVSGGSRQVKDVETALMWAVWDHEDAIRDDKSGSEYFLTNGSPIPKRLAYKYTIRSTAPVTLRGLARVSST